MYKLKKPGCDDCDCTDVCENQAKPVQELLAAAIELIRTAAYSPAMDGQEVARLRLLGCAGQLHQLDHAITAAFRQELADYRAEKLVKSVLEASITDHLEDDAAKPGQVRTEVNEIITELEQDIANTRQALDIARAYEDLLAEYRLTDVASPYDGDYVTLMRKLAQAQDDLSRLGL